MPTIIRFSGVGGDSITVDESPDDVLHAFSGSHGGPLRLTRDGTPDGIYINPARVACWYPSGGAGEMAEVPVIGRHFTGPI
jgi:hypothetical protein